MLRRFVVAKEREANRLRELGLLLRGRRATPARIISILTNFPFILNTQTPNPPLQRPRRSFTKSSFSSKAHFSPFNPQKRREGNGDSLSTHSTRLRHHIFPASLVSKDRISIFSPLLSTRVFNSQTTGGYTLIQAIHGRQPFNSSSSLKSHVCRCRRRQACRSRSASLSRRLPFARMGQTICRA